MQVLLAIILAGVISISVLYAELAIWDSVMHHWPKGCSKPAVPDLPSVLLVWSGLSLAVIRSLTITGNR